MKQCKCGKTIKQKYFTLCTLCKANRKRSRKEQKKLSKELTRIGKASRKKTAIDLLIARLERQQ